MRVLLETQSQSQLLLLWKLDVYLTLDNKYQKNFHHKPVILKLADSSYNFTIVILKLHKNTIVLYGCNDVQMYNKLAI